MKPSNNEDGFEEKKERRSAYAYACVERVNVTVNRGQLQKNSGLTRSQTERSTPYLLRSHLTLNLIRSFPLANRTVLATFAPIGTSSPKTRTLIEALALLAESHSRLLAPHRSQAQTQPTHSMQHRASWCRVTCFGPFSMPSFPDIPGIDDYQGITST